MGKLVWKNRAKVYTKNKENLKVSNISICEGRVKGNNSKEHRKSLDTIGLYVNLFAWFIYYGMNDNIDIVMDAIVWEGS